MRQRHARLTPGLIGLSVLVALVAPLPGCQPPDPDTPFDIYIGLLGRALGATTPAAVASAALPLPGRRDPPLSDRDGIDAATREIDILDLSSCALKANLVRARSSLGRHAKPSQRLLLVLDYLRLAPPCITLLRQGGRDALADAVQQGLAHRREQLPSFLFDATLGSGEYRVFWQPVAVPGEYPRVQHDQALAALTGINAQVRRWLIGDYRAANLGFEILLGEVAGGGGGALLEALARQGDWLAAADRLLREQPAGNAQCATKEQSEATVGRLLDARRYFELELQPRLARSTRRTRELLTTIAALEAMLEPALPPRYRDWRKRRNIQFRSLQEAPTRHLDVLARAIQSCRPP